MDGWDGLRLLRQFWKQCPSRQKGDLGGREMGHDTHTHYFLPCHKLLGIRERGNASFDPSFYSSCQYFPRERNKTNHQQDPRNLEYLGQGERERQKHNFCYSSHNPSSLYGIFAGGMNISLILLSCVSCGPVLVWWKKSGREMNYRCTLGFCFPHSFHLSKCHCQLSPACPAFKTLDPPIMHKPWFHFFLKGSLLILSSSHSLFVPSCCLLEGKMEGESRDWILVYFFMSCFTHEWMIHPTPKLQGRRKKREKSLISFDRFI